MPRGLEAGQAGVSCPSAGSCVTVGSGIYSTPTRSWGVSFSEIWDGKRWRYATMPGGGTNSVSCAAASRCVAVGDTESGGTQRAAALTWNGKAWAVTRVPAQGKGQASIFLDVTCLSAADCVAVGQAGPPGSPNTTGLTGFWNGKSWRLVTAQ